jgi:predicted acetyltransferase
MTSSPFDVRRLTEADVKTTVQLDGAAFGYEPPPDYFETYNRPIWELDRFIGAFDPGLAGEQVGAAGIYSMTMTFPGGRSHPVAGISWVSVRPGQQRRGVLTAMMRHQLDDLHEAGREPVAVLTASEAAIYGRFGYGLAVDRVRLEAVSGTPFRPGAVVQPVRQLPRDVAMPKVRELYRRATPTIAGLMTRSDAVWNSLYSDHDVNRDGATKLMFALHEDGFAAYRVKSDWTDRGPASTLSVHEISAVTPLAWASLWRHLLDYPLVREVVYRRAWIDDPLRDLVLDVRALRMPVTDHVWLRLVDLDRAIGLRTYRTACSVTIGLTDAFCPWNAGTWRLDLDTGGGSATKVHDESQVRMDSTDLAAALLGGQPVGRLANSGRVVGDPGSIEALGLALSTSLGPWVPEGF